MGVRKPFGKACFPGEVNFSLKFKPITFGAVLYERHDVDINVFQVNHDTVLLEGLSCGCLQVSLSSLGVMTGADSDDQTQTSRSDQP